MGTTESILHDDSPIETTAPMPAGQPPFEKKTPRTIGTNDKLGDREIQQEAKRPQRRAAKTTFKRMEGVILGVPKTGKRTLMSRLKGVDPFSTNKQEKSTENTSKETKKSNPSVIVPYKPPSESPTWDKIKLRIRYANSFDESFVKNENSNSKIDFVVVLINPRDARKTVQSHLEGVLTDYLDRLGYRDEACADVENDESIENCVSNDIKEPFCIAILLNFRDLEEKKKVKKDPIDINDINDILCETLLSRNVPDTKIVVELLQTSLLNCYGLDGLHRFIYRSYLQRTQADIERQLNVVRNQIQIADPNNSNHQSNEPLTYDEFLKVITQNPPTQPTTKPPPKSRTEPPTRPQPEPPMEQPIEPQHLSSSQTKDTQGQESSFRRINIRQPKKENTRVQASTLRIGKGALEAFLESSSDEEDVQMPSSKENRHLSGNDDDDSDDDSDDDFVIGGNETKYVSDKKRDDNSKDDRKNGANKKEHVLDDDDDGSGDDDFVIGGNENKRVTQEIENDKDDDDDDDFIIGGNENKRDSDSNVDDKDDVDDDDYVIGGNENTQVTESKNDKDDVDNDDSVIGGNENTHVTESKNDSIDVDSDDDYVIGGNEKKQIPNSKDDDEKGDDSDDDSDDDYVIGG